MIPIYLINHHTATARDTTTFASIKAGHIRRGWHNIGYHFFIDGKGNLYGYPQARGQDQVGAHAKKPMNQMSLGICLAGNFEIEQPSKEQLNTLKNLIFELQAQWNIPNENILGHGEVKGAKTLCPGKNFMPFIIGLREKNDCKNCEKLRKELKVANNKLIKIKEIVK